MATAEKKGKFENEWDKHNKKIHRTPKAVADFDVRFIIEKLTHSGGIRIETIIGMVTS